MKKSYDFLIVGSGFGGSVSALRLVEKGYSVAVVEKGKRYSDEDFPKTNWNLRKYLWLPFLRCFGIQNMKLFRHVLVLSGVGVGGGSLVYANTLERPSDDFFNASSWNKMGNWKEELAPHYETAEKMLGATLNPRLGFVDETLRQCASDLGTEESFRPTRVGVYFGSDHVKAGEKSKDPYFQGEGPDRNACIECGACMIGCQHNAKNTLPKNYLYFAEKKGVSIISETEVRDIQKDFQGYRVVTRSSTAWFKFRTQNVYEAKSVILSGGVLGTVSLLLRCKFQTRSLPQISSELGRHVRTNSEALVGITDLKALEKGRDYSKGIAIGSIFNANENTRIEPVRFPSRSSLIKFLAVPMSLRDCGRIRNLISNVGSWIRLSFFQKWAESSVILLVMQSLDNKMRLNWGRGLWTLFRKATVSQREEGQEPVPVHLPIANQVAQEFSKKVGGIPQRTLNEVGLKMATTAHILGGCVMGATAQEGVIQTDHQVFGYPGLYVCDGSAIPANLGVNPSLTIAAMTERAMAMIPKRKLRGCQDHV